jgi:capsular polysaccharide export protein
LASTSDLQQPAVRAHRFAATLVPAPGVQKIPHLEAFLPECGKLVRRATPTTIVDSVAGWGRKPTSRYARALAERRGWPYLALEDGFLRSVGLGESGAPPISLVVDDLGVYYDGARPSRLEALLQEGGWECEATLGRARAVVARIVASGLSKTNASPPLATGQFQRGPRRRVLVIDQTLGDVSIEGGLASRSTFDEMVAAAIRDEADAEIVVRRHPAVAAGLKQGCVSAASLGSVTVLDADCRLADVLGSVDAVYTVSSLAGFEALLRGLPVRCFGLPFYAGWGLTRDELTSPRRTRRRSIEELAAAAYLLYARYVDPLTGEPSTAETAIERLIAFRSRADQHAGFTAALGFAPWKHGSARTLLYSPRGRTEFFSRAASAVEAARTHGGRVVFWAARETPALAAELRSSTVPVWRMEDGFIRSRGLGSDFHRAASVILDDLGVYYDPSSPSRLETILRETVFPAELVGRAGELRAQLVRAGVSKYNIPGEQEGPSRWPRERFKLLVVGQVENDKSILKGCDHIRTNLALIDAARRNNPSAFIVYKPHPDVEAGNRPGAAPAEQVLRHADAIAADSDIDTCITAADGLATMTSLAGFEALLRGKPVWTFGRPFYGGWGLTHDELDFARRGRILALDELVAGALILYPLYIDPDTGLPCGPEDLVAAFERDRRLAAASRGPKRLRYLRGVFESLRTSAKARF